MLTAPPSRISVPSRAEMGPAQSVIPMPAAIDDEAAARILALARENDALNRQLSAANHQLIEAAIDAGNLHARIEALCADLAEMRAGRDAWRAEAERLVGWSVQSA